jgi:DNA primase
MANTSDDFPEMIEKLKATISITDLAESMGLKSLGKRFFCPRCQPQGGSTPDLVPYPKHLHCFKCGWHPDIFALVMEIRSCDFKSAVHFLGEIAPNPMAGKRMRQPNKFRSSPPQIEQQKQQSSRPPPSNVPWPLTQGQASSHGVLFGHSQALLIKNSKAIEYLRSRGFNLETIKDLVGYLPHGHWINRGREAPEGRLVFPHYDYRDPGRIINFYGRAISGSSPKHLRHDHGTGPKGFFSPNPQLALSSKTLLVTEGAFDCLAVHCSNPSLDIGIAAVFGTQSFKFEYFPCAKHVIFSFDIDQAGIVAVKKLAVEGLLRGIEVSTLPTAAYRSGKDLAESFIQGPLELKL